MVSQSIQVPHLYTVRKYAQKNKLHNAYHHSSTFLGYRQSREAEGIITGSFKVPLRSGVLVASNKYR